MERHQSRKASIFHLVWYSSLCCVWRLEVFYAPPSIGKQENGRIFHLMRNILKNTMCVWWIIVISLHIFRAQNTGRHKKAIMETRLIKKAHKFSGIKVIWDSLLKKKLLSVLASNWSLLCWQVFLHKTSTSSSVNWQFSASRSISCWQRGSKYLILTSQVWWNAFAAN